MQIEDAANYTSYTLYPHPQENQEITEDEALEILERKIFLNGLARSTFSTTA